ncbi:anti-sigma B factor antagonist [Marmoricola sp. OAE513]|uniref:STAS domain-containing protein n=1 Tax=Marmoricola sp. OAE513 TaxID=2817894 RepID=UPI001AEB022E
MNAPPTITTSPSTTGHVVVTVAGDHDLDTADDLRQQLFEAIGTNPQVVLDLSRMTFCDSVCLGVLVSSHQAAVSAGGWLRVAAPGTYIRRVLDLTRLDQVLSIHDSLEEAVRPSVEAPAVPEQRGADSA